MPNTRKNVGCPVEVTLRVLSGRWKVLVLHHLLERRHRFNELQRKLAGISQRTLVKMLRELEADGIVSRTVHPEVPPRVEYDITRLGRTLAPVLESMHLWGKAYAHRLPKVAPARG